jgi:hypothetical protein
MNDNQFLNMVHEHLDYFNEISSKYAFNTNMRLKLNDIKKNLRILIQQAEESK